MALATPHQTLKGIRLLSLALNLPGPAALMRCRQMGARCVKLEPAATATPTSSADPMSGYCAKAYATLSHGIRVVAADLKTDQGQKVLHRELAKADVLLTSFRPSALGKLGLGWNALHGLYPTLAQVSIVGAAAPRAEVPGHDLTYLAENDLITGLELPATLYADMGGSLMASEAVLQALLLRQKTGVGSQFEVALSAAAAYLALPRRWGLTQAGAAVGGGHAGYALYACLDGRVAVAALEPHFAQRLCTLAGLSWRGAKTLLEAGAQAQIGAYFATRSCQQLKTLATQHDLPLHTLAA